MMNHIKIVILLLLLSTVVGHAQNSIHVFSREIPWSNEAVSGDESKIYSINQAITNASAGDSIIIHEGIYREKVTVNKNNLIIQNYKNDYVLVTGAEIITDWSEALDMPDGIMMATIAYNIETDYTQLFDNGESEMMARHPNNTSGKMMEVLSDNGGYALLSNVYKDAGAGAEGHVTMEGTPLANVDLTGGIFRAMTGKMRNYVYGNITSNSGNTVNFTAINNGVWKNEAAISNTQHKFSWGFAMHKNLIDIPGEWYADGNKLYYMPQPGTDMDSTRIEIQVRERVLVMNNNSGSTIKGINFVAGNVDMQTTSDATIENCSFRYLHPFWTPKGYGQNDTDTKGIYLSNSDNNTFKDNYMAHTWGNMIALRSSENNSIQNCIIKDFGWVGIFTSGVHVSKGDNTNINQSTFGDAGRFQVRIDGNDPTKVNIIDCDFYGSMKMGEDAGPIEATSTGRIQSLDLKGSEIAYNKIHDVSGVPVSDGNYKRVKATAFYMEDTENYTAHHNLIYNIKHDGYEGPHEIEKVGEFLYLGPRYNAMYEPVNYYNNTIWNVDENIGIWNIVITNWAELGITPPDTTGFIKDGHFANNIFMNGPSYRINYSAQVLNSTGGKVSWASSPAGSSIETHNFHEYTTHCAKWNYHFNPETNAFFDFADASKNFVDAANGNFTLIETSAAKGAGTALEGYTSSTTPDIGALEGSDRVLHAGANLSEPDFKEEGVNFIADTEWIKYIDFPEQFADSTTAFEFKIAYNTFESRDIVISFRTPEDEYLSQGRKTVPQGNDTTLISVVSETAQAIAEGYIFMAALRPVGGKWNENIVTTYGYADITEVFPVNIAEIKNAQEIKIYPIPASDYINFSGLKENGQDYTIYSLQGKIMQQGIIPSRTEQLDISTLQAGIYIIKLDENSKMLMIK